MSVPVYVLLPSDVEWSLVDGTRAQASKPVRWYLRQHMAEAATQTVVLVTGGDDAELGRRVAAVARRAEQLGGIALDGASQEPIDAETGTVAIH